MKNWGRSSIGHVNCQCSSPRLMWKSFFHYKHVSISWHASHLYTPSVLGSFINSCTLLSTTWRLTTPTAQLFVLFPLRFGGFETVVEAKKSVQHELSLSVYLGTELKKSTVTSAPEPNAAHGRSVVHQQNIWVIHPHPFNRVWVHCMALQHAPMMENLFHSTDKQMVLIVIIHDII